MLPYSPHLFAGKCIDIVRRISMFITLVCGVLGSLPGYFENPK